MDRRSFLRLAGGAVVGTKFWPSVSWAASIVSPAALPLGPSPSAGWVAAAEEAWRALEGAGERFLRYFREPGGVDRPGERPDFLPPELIVSETLTVMDLLPISPHEIAAEAARQRWYREARSRDPNWLATPCTPLEVGALSTDSLRSRLLGIGIDARPSGFLALVGETVTPWALSERWLAGRSDLTRPEGDFATLAARELWQRTSPRPDDETLDDWAHRAQWLGFGGEHAGASESWLRVWKHLRPRLSSAITTTYEADRAWAGSLPFSNMVPTAARSMLIAGRTEPRLAASAVGMIEDALAQFREDGALKEELFTLLATRRL